MLNFSLEMYEPETYNKIQNEGNAVSIIYHDYFVTTLLLIIIIWLSQDEYVWPTKKPKLILN